MTTNKVEVLNTHTGQVGLVSRVIFESDFFNPDGLLVEVENQKPYVPELFTSKFEVPDDESDEDSESNEEE